MLLGEMGVSFLYSPHGSTFHDNVHSRQALSISCTRDDSGYHAFLHLCSRCKRKFKEHNHENRERTSGKI